MSQNREWRIAGIVSLTSEREWNLAQKWWGLRRVGSAGIVTRGRPENMGTAAGRGVNVFSDIACVSSM